jgi:hypothetical protein
MDVFTVVQLEPLFAVVLSSSLAPEFSAVILHVFEWHNSAASRSAFDASGFQVALFYAHPGVNSFRIDREIRQYRCGNRPGARLD